MSIIDSIKEKHSIEANVKKVDKLATLIQASAILDREDTTICNLQRLSEVLSNLLDNVKTNYKHSELRASFVNEISKMHNKTSSVLDLADAKELTEEDAASYIKSINKRVQKFDKFIASLNAEKIKKHNEKEAKKRDSEYSEVTETAGFVNLNRQGDSVLKLINESEPIIEHFQKDAKDFPVTPADAKNEFILKRAPLVVMTDPIITTSEWIKSGMEAQSIGYYSILQNQLVIGISSAKVSEKRMDLKQYRNFVIENLEKKMGQKLFVLGKPFGYKNSGYTYVWVVPEKVTNHIRNTTKKKLVVREVGLAFK